jgi:hypothetical protein
MNMEVEFMHKLSTQFEVHLAETALRGLRGALESCKRATGTRQYQEKDRLASSIQVTSAAIDCIRHDTFSSGARALVIEYDRLEKSAAELVQSISRVEHSAGPHRAKLSPQQRAEFIRNHGHEKYLNLPE